MLKRVDLRKGAWYDYDVDWMGQTAADALLTELCARDDWEQRPIVVFGKEVMQPRLVTWEGELDYRYSGQTLPGRPMTPTIAALNARISELVGVPFNHVLFNRYRSGNDAMGFHADDEPELGHEPVIAALSVGVPRKFVMKPKRKKNYKKQVSLAHGSLLVMGGTMQHSWYHGVPRQLRVEEERVNITFRYVKGPPGWREARPGDDRRPPASSE